MGVGCSGCAVCVSVGACRCGMPWVQNTVPSFSCSGAPRVTAARWRSWPPWGWCTGTGQAGGPPVLAPAPAEAAWSPGGGGATTPGTAWRWPLRAPRLGALGHVSPRRLVGIFRPAFGGRACVGSDLQAEMCNTQVGLLPWAGEGLRSEAALARRSPGVRMAVIWARALLRAKVVLLTPAPDGSVGRESACNAGDPGLIPGSGRSAGEGRGSPLQYSGQENSIDCIVHGVTKAETTERLSLSGPQRTTQACLTAESSTAPPRSVPLLTRTPLPWTENTPPSRSQARHWESMGGSFSYEFS